MRKTCKKNKGECGAHISPGHIPNLSARDQRSLLFEGPFSAILGHSRPFSAVGGCSNSFLSVVTTQKGNISILGHYPSFSKPHQRGEIFSFSAILTVGPSLSNNCVGRVLGVWHMCPGCVRDECCVWFRRMQGGCRGENRKKPPPKDRAVILA
jgi:hypothetical protein